MKDNKIIYKRIVYYILLICNFILIFIFSNQNGETSSSVSQGFVLNFLKMFVKDPIKLSSIVLIIEPLIRKLAHFSIYALSGIWMLNILKTYKIKFSKMMLIGSAIGLIYACTDEIHQVFVSSRAGRMLDVVIDLLGFLFGMLITKLTIEICVRLKSK